MKVPVCTPFLGEEEKKLVLVALEKGEISGTFGEFIPRFEREFAEYCGCRYGVATTSGTTALHLALATLGIGPGDEVLVSTFTNMATFFAVHYQGARPIPIDIEPDTWNLNPALLEPKITPRTKAILVVHIYGHPVDMDPVIKIAKKHNLFVIEDAAEAHGAEYKGKKAGSLSDISCFSFYANKIITTGEGGMVVTSSKEYAERARMLQSLAYGKEERFMHKAIAFNYRMTNLQAALGCAQLKKIDKVVAMKRRIAKFYLQAFENIPEIKLPVEKEYAKNVYWMFHVVLQGALAGKRNAIISALSEKGIGIREAFVPYNRQKIALEKKWTQENDCPVANHVSENGLYLPSGPEISDEDLAYVVETVREIIRKVV